MPRTADHTIRREQIADAAVRVAGRAGLQAVTMRAVAAEADVSLRLVQYYFHSKAGLLAGTLTHLTELSNQRWTQRLAVLSDPPPPRAVLEAFFAEALPTDEPSRAFHLVGTSYAVLALTDPEVAQHPFITGIDRLEAVLAEALSRARAAGELSIDIDIPTEATHLVMLSHGLGTSVLIGQHTVDTARSVFRRYLDRLFLP